MRKRLPISDRTARNTLIVPATIILLWACSASSRATDLDVGVRFFDGVSVTTAAVEPAATSASPIRVRKNGQNYGVMLVDPTHADATKLRVATSSGIKAVKKYRPCSNSPIFIPPEFCPSNGACGTNSNPAQSPKWDGKNIRDDVIADVGPAHPDFNNYTVKWGDTAGYAQICRLLGYASWADPYQHVMASCSDNPTVSFDSGTKKWVWHNPCVNHSFSKRLRCFNKLPLCNNGYDDDGDCLIDMADPDCSSPADDTEN